ncbi:MAG: RNA methyltransferase [Balneolaceae bacterium]|nr:RNA methyltransferase [Balneolaceae bacterium]
MQPASNRQLTLLRKLGQKKYRQKHRQFMVEGERAVEQVIRHGGVELLDLYMDFESELWKSTSWKAHCDNNPCFGIDRGDFREIADTDNPQGVIARCRIPGETPLERMAERSGVLLASDRIQDPGNLGTIMRTAVWFGVGGILCGKGTVDLFHPKVVRSTAGSTGVLPYINGELEELLPRLEQLGWEVLLMDAAPDATDLTEAGFGPKSVLVVGNEAAGISKDLKKNHRKRIKIARIGGREQVESLNASVAAAIAIYSLTGSNSG